MSYKHRIDARTDANQKSIVKQLRQIPGVSVEINHDDILCGYRKKTFWYEIKRPELKKKKSEGYRKGSIKKSQERLLNDWNGHFLIVSTIEEILEDMGISI